MAGATGIGPRHRCATNHHWSPWLTWAGVGEAGAPALTRLA